jgi:D-lyxose ketol-isomerase
MKRSEINRIMQSASDFLAEHRFYLPPFANWTPEDWRTKGSEVSGILAGNLGWDITDFGLGDFQKTGLFLFTIRNGKPENWATKQGKIYAEKVLIVDVDQITPMHFHWKKMEDIINRGGGDLVIQLYNSTLEEELDLQSPVKVETDGVLRTIQPGGIVELKPGESITLTQGLYHKFWGKGSRVLVGEVSLVNDDAKDNRFYKPTGRFPEIEEDVAPLHLLVVDYPRYTQIA